jgi:hypothetical protein
MTVRQSLAVVALVAGLGTAPPQVAGPPVAGRLSLDVNVTAANGSFVTNLTRDDFQVDIDGVAAQIDTITSTSTPVTLLLVFDVSMSAALNLFPDMPFAQGAHPRPRYDPQPLVAIVTRRFFEKMPPTDLIRPAGLGRRLLVTPGFTSDRRQLIDATMAALQPDPQERAGPSPIWDVVKSAIDVMKATAAERRAIVLLTDGEATGVRLTAAEAGRAAADAAVAVHVISLSFDLQIPQDTDPPEFIRPNDGLRELADTSGGVFLFQGEPRAYVPSTYIGEKNPDAIRMTNARWDDVGEPLSRVADALHRSYTIWLRIDQTAGSEHAVHVRVRKPGLQVHARRWALPD